MPDWVEPVGRYILEDGLPGTLYVSAIAVVGSAVIGVVLGTLLTIDFPPLRAAIRLYIEVWRGLPILVTVFIVYFGLPSISPELEFGPLSAAAIALVVWGSAQVAEATRGAVQSIPREQHEAAAALGFGWLGRHCSVILPQALPLMIPPAGNLTVQLIKSTPLMFLVGVVDVFTVGDMIRQGQPGSVALVMLGVLVVFFLLSMTVVAITQLLENWAKRRLGQKPVRISTATVAGAAPAGEVV